MTDIAPYIDQPPSSDPNSLSSEAAAWAEAPVGTPLPADMQLVEWEHYGRCLRTYHAHLTWKVVDWLLHAERRWGETYHQFAEASGFSRGALMNYASVGARTIEARRPELSFSHHQAVASLPTPAQRVLLQASLDHEWTRDELRAQVQQWKTATAPRTDDVIEADFTPRDVPGPAEHVATDTSADGVAPDQGPSRHIAACCSAGIHLIPDPSTTDELVGALLTIITEERAQHNQTLVDIARSASGADTLLVDAERSANQRLRARIAVLEAELAKPAPAPPAPDPNTCVISDLDMPYLRAIHKAVEAETGSNWTFGGAVGKALQDHAEYLGLKVRR